MRALEDRGNMGCRKHREESGDKIAAAKAVTGYRTPKVIIDKESKTELRWPLHLDNAGLWYELRNGSSDRCENWQSVLVGF